MDLQETMMKLVVFMTALGFGVWRSECQLWREAKQGTFQRDPRWLSRDLEGPWYRRGNPVMAQYSIPRRYYNHNYRQHYRQRPEQPPKPVQPRQSAKCGIIEMKKFFGGEAAKRGQFPWQVALYYQFGGKGRETVECGGALIHPMFVLTAAHCFDPDVIKTAKLTKLLLGGVDINVRDENTQEVVPDRIECHPEYRANGPSGQKNIADICLLRLPKQMPYTEFIRPVCLPLAPIPGDLGAQGGNFTAAGWGGIDQFPVPEKSDRLMFGRLPAMTWRPCRDTLNTRPVIAPHQGCAGGGKQDTCRGDSGGPLVRPSKDDQDRAYEVIGVVSYGSKRCGTGQPTVFTRVDSFLPWIRNVIAKV